LFQNDENLFWWITPKSTLQNENIWTTFFASKISISINLCYSNKAGNILVWAFASTNWANSVQKVFFLEWGLIWPKALNWHSRKREEKLRIMILGQIFCFKNIHFHNLVKTRQETFLQEFCEWQFSKLPIIWKKFVWERGK